MSGTYTTGDGLSYFATKPLDGDPVAEGAGWIRDIIDWMNDATAGPATLNQLPIGSIFMHAAAGDTDPATFLGYGVWSRISGRVLIGAGTGSGLTARVIGAEGGEETHVLTEAELAAHAHNIYGVDGTGSWGQPNGWDKTTNGETAIPGEDGGTKSYRNANSGSPTKQIIEDTGSGTAHENMPPFLVVSMWKRDS